MIEEIDLQRFLEVIENEGCLKRWSNVVGEYTVHDFVSKYGNTSERILEDGETIEREVALKHLAKLEIFYVAEQLFPPKKEDFENDQNENIAAE